MQCRWRVLGLYVGHRSVPDADTLGEMQWTHVTDSALKRLRQTVGDFPFPHQAAALLDNPLRRRWEDPAVSVDVLSLDGHESVLEIGPGPGFFSLEIAARLTTGHLSLFDIQPEMLDKARRKLATAGYVDVGFHVGEAGTDLPFADGQFDAAFLAEVIGEVNDKHACVRSLARVIKPGGSLVFHEAFPDPDRLSLRELRELAEPLGFELVDARRTRWRDIVRFQNGAG